jgi:hypothetical protein
MKTTGITRSKVIGLLEGTVLGLVLVAAIAVGTSANRQSESGLQAWTDRLQAQAESYAQTRIRQAWTSRLEAQAQQQVNNAWTDRLNGLAAGAGATARANTAWTDRLNGLAEESLTDR